MQFSEFPKHEYESRLNKIQNLMGEEGIDVLLITAKQNYRYITGHYTETWLNPSRPVSCWVPREGEPVLMICESEEGNVGETSWIKEIRTYAGLSVGPGQALGSPEIGFEPKIIRTLADTGRSIGLGPGKRIGFEFGSHSRFELPIQVLRGLETAFEGAEWVDAAPLLWEARAIKSRLEIDYLKQAVRALDLAFPALFDGITPGVTESDVFRRLKLGILGAGADETGYINVIGDVRNPLFGTPSSRQLLNGAMIYVDGGAVCHGYWSDYARMAVIGEASDAQRKAYSVSINAVKQGISAIKPGSKAGDIAREIYNALEEGGIGGSEFGRVGHGIGLEMPEPPSLHPDDTTILKPGMVLCIEPNLFYPDVGYLVAEEEVVVTEDGCEVMSKLAPEVVVCL